MFRRPFDRQRDGEERCHHCGAVTGEYHSLGCMGEVCPKCGNLLVTCTCDVMDAEGKAIAVRRLFNAINNAVAAWAFAAYYPRLSPIGLAGWLWATLNSDPEMIISMVRTEAGVLANIKASLCNTAGSPRYSVADIARALGLGKRLIVELEQAFADVEVGRKTETLMRVH